MCAVMFAGIAFMMHNDAHWQTSMPGYVVAHPAGPSTEDPRRREPAAPWARAAEDGHAAHGCHDGCAHGSHDGQGDANGTQRRGTVALKHPEVDTIVQWSCLGEDVGECSIYLEHLGCCQTIAALWRHFSGQGHRPLAGTCPLSLSRTVSLRWPRDRSRVARCWASWVWAGKLWLCQAFASPGERNRLVESNRLDLRDQPRLLASRSQQ